MKHTILFLAANPRDTDRLALDEECAAIERELRMTSGRDDFDFRSKWAVSVDELMRHLNELQPALLHFSGHGGSTATRSPPASGDPPRDVVLPRPAGIFLQDEGSSQLVTERALAKMIESASPSTRVVLLNACYSAALAESLRHVVDCVVGMDGAIGDAAARSFAVGFYRALGNRRSVGNAVDQAVATLAGKQLPDHLPVCKTRDGLVADQILLVTSGPDAPSEPRGAGATAVHEATLDCIEQLSEARSRSESRVKWVRGLAQSGELGRDELRGVQLAYDDARASINAGLDRLLADVESGGADSERAFRALGSRADECLKKFLETSSELIEGTSRGVLDAALVRLGSMVSVFLTASQQLRDQAERRAALVRRLERARWAAFDEVA